MADQSGEGRVVGAGVQERLEPALWPAEVLDGLDLRWGRGGSGEASWVEIHVSSLPSIARMLAVRGLRGVVRRVMKGR